MRRSRRLVLCALFALMDGPASRAQYFDWAVGFGGVGNTIETADKIHVDQVGNLYLLGQFSEDVDFDLGPDTFLLGANDQNVFVAKYTPEGDLYWAVRFGGAPGARVWPGASVTTRSLATPPTPSPPSCTRGCSSRPAKRTSSRGATGCSGWPSSPTS